ncbi:hypothetical protein ACQB6R_08745 [Propionibacteriaceae bacterium G1746]
MDDPTPLSAPEMFALGWNHDTIRTALRRGEVTRLRRGAYLIGTPDDALLAHLSLVRATAASIGGDTVFSHLSAAAMWGMPMWRLHPGRQVWVTRRGPTRGNIRGPAHAHNCLWTEDEVTVVDGVPVTTVARTVVDLARRWGPDAGVVAADWALAQGIERSELLDVLAVHRRRPGVRAARMVVPFASARAESPAESVSRLRMHQLGIPTPLEQVVITNEYGVELARSDFGWMEHMVLGECDGRTKYDQPRTGARPSDAVAAEKIRDRRLREQGYHLVHWLPEDLDRPQTFGRMLRRALQITT